MNRWVQELRLGKRELALHRPATALKAFESALNLCPVERPRELATIFYYLAFTLMRLQRPNGAVRSLRAAMRLRKGSCHSAKMARRFGNDYGMARQRTPELDDWQAFYSIHLQRYLRSKHSQRIVTDAEGDMIRDLIHDYWNRLKELRLLVGKSAQEKLEVFRSVRVIFPFYVAPGAQETNVITVDFHKKSRLDAQDRCPCGSGMAYMKCCGRTRGADELVPGTF